MEQLALYIPGLMGLAVALAAFISVRHISRHRADRSDTPLVDPPAGDRKHPFDIVAGAPILEAQPKPSITIRPHQSAV